MTKEEAYDKEIAPLMTRIIAVCQANKIAALCDFALDDDLKCTTSLLTDEYDPPDSMLAALRHLKPR